jgi:hypothetical protein
MSRHLLYVMLRKASTRHGRDLHRREPAQHDTDESKNVEKNLRSSSMQNRISRKETSIENEVMHLD